jgi:hypothetical protein
MILINSARQPRDLFFASAKTRVTVGAGKRQHDATRRVMAARTIQIHLNSLNV